MKTRRTKRGERYFAVIEFKGGTSADCRSGNLRELARRCRAGFRGERTDWGIDASSQAEKWEIRDLWSDGARIVASSED